MSLSSPLNLDCNASEGLLPEVRAALQEVLENQESEALNPSSIHTGGQRARLLIEEARVSIAECLGLRHGDRVIFTSGATEANATALMGLYWSKRALLQEGGLVTTASEHPSVLECAKRLAQHGVPMTTITAPLADTSMVADQVPPETTLASIIFANNETGHIAPIASLAAAIRTRAPGALIHTDAVQAMGKITFRFPELGVDLMSISAHKIGGLSGVGALVVSRDVALDPLLVGGPQETRWRAGTENVAGIASFGYAARHVARTLDRRLRVMRELRALLKSILSSQMPDAIFHCRDERGLPNTLSVEIPGILSDDLVVALDVQGIRISSGAACASGKPEPSHVLRALGLSDSRARSTIRISVSERTPKEDAAAAASLIAATALRMRGDGGRETTERAA